MGSVCFFRFFFFNKESVLLRFSDFSVSFFSVVFRRLRFLMRNIDFLFFLFKLRFLLFVMNMLKYMYRYFKNILMNKYDGYNFNFVLEGVLR